MGIENVKLESPGLEVLLTGNEAVARGALEAGVRYAASYPGSPSAEVLDTLAAVSAQFDLYAEWSVNEKVAAEGAAAASFAGIRSLAVMKPDGFNVAVDFFTSLSLSGVRGGMVLMVGDDPGAHSSIKEEDSRYLARLAHLPVFEPATVQEAKDMTFEAFDLSEQIGLPVVVRCVTRICHASAVVKLGRLCRPEARPGLKEKFFCTPQAHSLLEEKLRKLAAAGGGCSYTGPEGARTVIVTAGPAYAYCLEALEILKLDGLVGILKLGRTWPLPERDLLKYLGQAREVIFAEEIEPFIEENVTSFAAYHWPDLSQPRFFGKRSGHVAGPLGPGIGELTPDIMVNSLAGIMGLNYPGNLPGKEQPERAGPLPGRDRSFCAGCPHRASYWAIKSALALDGRDGFVLGDIGCYAIGRGRTGFYLLSSVHSMGSGVGLANGFGKLGRFSFSQPVVAVVGDSTFYHAVVPALINARANNSDFLCVILDNETTAMTGHQPHPGSGRDASGNPSPRVGMEDLIRGLGLPVLVCDPYDIPSTVGLITSLLSESGPRVLVLRRACALAAARGERRPRAFVDPELCLGDGCGCNRFCSRVFGCPANIWDREAGKARIDEAVCVGCGVCATLCPQGAIKLEEA